MAEGPAGSAAAVAAANAVRHHASAAAAAPPVPRSAPEVKRPDRQRSRSRRRSSRSRRRSRSARSRRRRRGGSGTLPPHTSERYDPYASVTPLAPAALGCNRCAQPPREHFAANVPGPAAAAAGPPRVMGPGSRHHPGSMHPSQPGLGERCYGMYGAGLPAAPGPPQASHPGDRWIAPGHGQHCSQPRHGPRSHFAGPLLLSSMPGPPLLHSIPGLPGPPPLTAVGPPPSSMVPMPLPPGAGPAPRGPWMGSICHPVCCPSGPPRHPAPAGGCPAPAMFGPPGPPGPLGPPGPPPPMLGLPVPQGQAHSQVPFMHAVQHLQRPLPPQGCRPGPGPPGLHGPMLPTPGGCGPCGGYGCCAPMFV